MPDRKFPPQSGRVYRRGDSDVTPGQLRGGAFAKPFRNVYVPSEDLKSALRIFAAALVAAGDEAVLSDHSAAHLFGIPLPLGVDATRPVHVTLPAPLRGEHQARLTVHTRQLDGVVIKINGLRTTNVVRTWFDLARQYSGHDLVAITDAVLHQRLATVEELRSAAVERRGWPGSRNAVTALADADRRSESWWETISRLALKEASIEMVPQVDVCDASGEFIARVDLADEARKVAFEFDGSQHFDEAQQKRDVRRVQRLQRAGWIVLRFTAADLIRRRIDVIDEVRRALNSRSTLAA